MKAPLRVLASVLVLAAAIPGAAAAGGGWHAPIENPCQGRAAKHLLCPDLRIGPPSEMYVSTYEGKTLLHATSDVRSRGRGYRRSPPVRSQMSVHVEDFCGRMRSSFPAVARARSSFPAI